MSKKTEKNQVKSLADLMKKQISSKQNKTTNSPNSSSKPNTKPTENELEQEKITEAKKESKGKAANYNKSEMMKRLIIETIMRYSALVILLICSTFVIINFIPSLIFFIKWLIQSITSDFGR